MNTQTTPTPELVALQYRKRPVVIEAVQLTNEVASVCLRDRVPGPFGLTVFGSWNQKSGIVYNAHINIETMEGKMRADLGDWIIREPFPTGDRQFYPCKPDIFAATYEPATRAATLPQGVVDSWISVKDRTPPEDTPVWCYISGGDPFVGGYCFVDGDEESGWAWHHCENSHYMKDGDWVADDFIWDDDYPVTHWQPLPTPPPAELGKGDGL